MNESHSRYIDYMYSYPHKTAYRAFAEPVSLLPYLNGMQGRTASLYFHLPFCSHKCGYCNLFSLQTNRAEDVERYLQMLRRQAEQLAPLTTGLTFDGLAIGGGTPLLLSVPQLEQVLDMASLFGVRPSRVFTTVETSPEYADTERLELLKQAGVARLSIGIQSFVDEELVALKRRPRRDSIYRALEAICLKEFRSFNIDLIYGIKGQTVDSFLYSLEQALRFQPDELFIYPLYVRRDTGISERESDETCFRIYCAARDRLASCGFLQTSMRRFVRHAPVVPELSCGDEVVLSCGSGGRSYVGNLHYATRYTVSQRCVRTEIENYLSTTDFTRVGNGILLSDEEQRRRFLIKNLMYHTGIDRAVYGQRFGGDPADMPLFGDLMTRGWVEESADGCIRLTPEGMGYSDYIGPLFISSAVRKRMQTYVY